MMMNRFRYMLLAISCVVLLAASGCTQTAPANSGSSSSGSSAPAASSSSKSSSSAAAKVTIPVYFANGDGTKLVAEKRTLETDKTTDKYTAAVKSLLAGPKQGGVAVIPKAAKLRSVKVVNGTAKVDFTPELTKSFSGGSTGELMLVGSIVDTLTEFPEVKAVQFLINGKEVEPLAGHMDTSVPIKRMEKLLSAGK